MNETDGTVVRVEGEYAWVRAEGAGHACGTCASRSACSSAGNAASLLGGLLDEVPDPHLLRIPNPIQARPGDRVVIRAADGTVLRAAWLAYGMPLVLALAGAALAVELTGSDAAAAVLALLGLGVGFFVLYLKGKASAAEESILTIEFKRAFR